MHISSVWNVKSEDLIDLKWTCFVTSFWHNQITAVLRILAVHFAAHHGISDALSAWAWFAFIDFLCLKYLQHLYSLVFLSCISSCFLQSLNPRVDQSFSLKFWNCSKHMTPAVLTHVLYHHPFHYSRLSFETPDDLSTSSELIRTMQCALLGDGFLHWVGSYGETDRAVCGWHGWRAWVSRSMEVSRGRGQRTLSGLDDIVLRTVYNKYCCTRERKIVSSLDLVLITCLVHCSFLSKPSHSLQLVLLCLLSLLHCLYYLLLLYKSNHF